MFTCANAFVCLFSNVTTRLPGSYFSCLISAVSLPPLLFLSFALLFLFSFFNSPCGDLRSPARCV